MNKRWRIAAFVLALFTGAFFLVRQALPQHTPNKPQQASVLGETLLPTVTLRIEDSAGPDRIFSGIRAGSPYAALLAIPKEAAISVGNKQYDFGVFVTSIAGRDAGLDQAWMYEVNGTMGTVAADRYVLKDGDSVVWRLTMVSAQQL